LKTALRVFCPGLLAFQLGRRLRGTEIGLPLSLLVFQKAEMIASGGIVLLANRALVFH
jgi:hypothetical protein